MPPDTTAGPDRRAGKWGVANDTEFGLTLLVFSNDLNEAMNAVNQLQFGEIYVNREHFEAVQGYHAGWRKSGIGGADGIPALLEGDSFGQPFFEAYDFAMTGTATAVTTIETEGAVDSPIPFDVSPTIAIAGGRAILATTALFAKREVKRVLGDDLSGASMRSTKSAIGHLLGGAGAVEAIFCILAMRDQIVPPTLNLHNPDEGTEGVDLVPLTAKKREVRAVLNNSFGFGGTNASLVLKKVD